jgi:hypothetical protein
MRIGYSFWGFLGDYKLDDQGSELQSPDGNATYSWSLIWEMLRRGHSVYAMQKDRDWPAYKVHRQNNFSSFSQEKRYEAYAGLKHTFGSSEVFPELDILLVEWRFPIEGRNCVMKDGELGFPLDFQGMPESNLQPDLYRQHQILQYYKSKNTKIILWDLDHKLEKKDEQYWDPHAVFETSESPLELFKKRTQVQPPFHIPDLLQHTTLPSEPQRKLVYIGSRYERDDVIDEWLRPISEAFPAEVEFHGKWGEDARRYWPKIGMFPRCTTKDFRRIYGDAVACPLLAKRSYLQSGFITPRPWEALLFGTLPVGLCTAKGIEKYANLVAQSPSDMIDICQMLSSISLEKRSELRKENVQKLDFMDAKHFIDKVESVS